MKIKRLQLTNDSAPTLAILSNYRWVPLKLLTPPQSQQSDTAASPDFTDMIAVLQAEKSMHDKWQAQADEYDEQLPEIEDTPLLPFQPRSYRDFMLFEQHVINASRGYARRFMPISYKIAATYESLFKLTFPKFRPHPLWYKKPIYYMGNHLNFVTDQHQIAFPSYTKALDYELELGAVIVKHLKNASEKEAMNAIGGFVVLNDFSARDVQLAEMRSGFGPVKAKHFINSISSTLVTADEIMPHLYNLSGKVRINGRPIVTTSTSDMDYTLGEAIAYASKDEQLYPGEFIGSGTLLNGCGMENGHWLKPEDIIELEIERVLVMWLGQDSIMFPGAGYGPRSVDAVGVRSFTLEGPQGPFRVAEYVPQAPVAVLVFFVGNGEDLVSAGWRARSFGRHGLAVVCPEYPGYGGSAGKPGVEELYAVARVATAYAAGLARERGLPLVGGGISLGTFCAVHVAAQGQIERLFLAAPPTSMAAAAAARFPWLPVALLLRHRFDSLAMSPMVRCPVLVVHGEDDRIIPIELGERLFEALPGKKEFLRVPGAGHNDLPLAANESVGARVGAFLRGQ